MKVIDFHAHIYPDKIAKKASLSIGQFYDMKMDFDGTVDNLLETGKRAKVDMFVVHSVATDPKQVESINDFIARTVNEHPGKLMGFATMHPDYPDIEKEIDRVTAMGLKGVKIHPDFQKFNIDSKEAYRIYEVIEGRLPILIHTGDFRYEYSKVKRVVNMIDKFPRLTAICAHFGGWSEWEEAARVLAGRNVMVDTSSSFYALTAQRAEELIRMYGIDRVLFGSDYPMWDAEDELEFLDRMDLTQEEMEKILHGNAERLLGL